MENNFFDNVFAELSRIVKFLKDNQHRPPNPEVSDLVYYKIAQIKKMLEEFKKISNQTIKETGTKLTQVKDGVRLPPPGLDKENREIWEKLQYYKEELIAIQPMAEEAIAKGPSLSEVMKDKSKKKVHARQKRMAKGTGYNEQWKKL